MLTEDVPFHESLMIDKKLNRKANSMQAKLRETA